jgi:hypothetical protein
MSTTISATTPAAATAATRTTATATTIDTVAIVGTTAATAARAVITSTEATHHPQQQSSRNFPIFQIATAATQTVAVTTATIGLYYKNIRIVNDDSSVINKLGASITHDARVVINDCHMFIVQATEASIAITAAALKTVLIA